MFVSKYRSRKNCYFFCVSFRLWSTRPQPQRYGSRSLRVSLQSACALASNRCHKSCFNQKTLNSTVPLGILVWNFLAIGTRVFYIHYNFASCFEMLIGTRDSALFQKWVPYALDLCGTGVNGRCSRSNEHLKQKVDTSWSKCTVYTRPPKKKYG